MLDAGEIVEFDEPFALLQRRGQLYDMCRKTGKDMFNHLMNLAKESHLQRFNTNEVDDEDRESSGSGDSHTNHKDNVVMNQIYDCINTATDKLLK